MSTQEPTQRWRWLKPAVYGFVLGLIVGPSISGYFGWQVLADTDQQRVQRAVINQDAKICALLARREVAHPGQLEYGQRHNLAEKYAKLPWVEQVDFHVVDACADALTGDKQVAAQPGQG